MAYLEECSTASCVVCEPELRRTCGGGTVDQGLNCNYKHRQSKRVPFGGSLARIDHPSANEKRRWHRFVLVTYLASAGQRMGMFQRASCRFMLLNAFEASTRITASVSASAKTLARACVAALQPAGWPAHISRGPAAARISWRSTLAMVFPIIRLAVSQTQTGRTPGFLSSGMRRHPISA